MKLTLPKLQLRLPIVDKSGCPTDTFHRYMNVDFANPIVRNAADVAAQLVLIQQAQADIIATQEQIIRVLTGQENFTALLVNNQNVRPFLDKTDGDAIIDSSAFAAGVVNTGAIAAGAITTPHSAVTFGVIDGKVAGNLIVQTLSVTTIAGDIVDILGTVSISSLGNGATLGGSLARGVLYIYRDGTALTLSEVGNVINDVAVRVNAPIAFTDIPGAGTFTYTIQSVLSTVVDVDTYDISFRYMSATVSQR